MKTEKDQRNKILEVPFCVKVDKWENLTVWDNKEATFACFESKLADTLFPLTIDQLRFC